METNQSNQDPALSEATGEVPQENILNESDFSMDGYDKHIRTARIWLFIVAGVQLIPIFMLFPIDSVNKWVQLGILAFIGLVFVGLAFWTKKKPVAAIVTALILYVLLVLSDGLVDWTEIFKGIIMKIAIVVALIVGLRNAREAENLKKAFRG